LLNTSRAASRSRNSISREMGSLCIAWRLCCLRLARLLWLFRGVFEGPLAKLAHAALYRMHEMDLYGPIRVVSRGWTTNLTRAVRPRIQLSWFPNGARSSAGRPGYCTA
jgi:hypothetical protein